MTNIPHRNWPEHPPCKGRKYSFKYIQRYLSCGSRGFYPVTLRVALHAKCLGMRAPPLRDNLSMQGRPPRSDERRAAPLPYKLSQAHSVYLHLRIGAVPSFAREGFDTPVTFRKRGPLCFSSPPRAHTPIFYSLLNRVARRVFRTGGLEWVLSRVGASPSL